MGVPKLRLYGGNRLKTYTKTQIINKLKEDLIPYKKYLYTDNSFIIKIMENIS